MPKSKPAVDGLFPEPSPQTDLALAFAQAVAAGEFKRAQALLSSPLQVKATEPSLRRAFKAMVAYGEGPPATVEVVMSMTEWPDKKRDDIEWVYVAIGNDTTRKPSRLSWRGSAVGS